jgi:hypothetical protein
MLLVKEFKHARHIQRQIQPIKVSKMLAIYVPMGLRPFEPWPLFQFLYFYTESKTPWTGISPSQGLYLHTGQHKDKRIQTSMRQVVFELTTPAIERAKAIHALECATIVIS